MLIIREKRKQNKVSILKIMAVIIIFLKETENKVFNLFWKLKAWMIKKTIKLNGS